MTKTWRDTIREFLSPRVVTMLFLGFSAGVPLLLVFSTLSVWLREAEVERATIGFFSWAALGYGFKFIWAPMIDRMPLPVLARMLGQRRSWLLVAQLAIVTVLALTAFNDPAQNLALTAALAVVLGFSSATQDIVIDAYRIEAADREFQGMMSAAYIAGYRIGMIAAGAGALNLAGLFDPDPATYQQFPWRVAYLAMAGAMGIGLVTTFAIAEPKRGAGAPASAWSSGHYARFLGIFLTAVAAFAAVFAGSGDLVAPVQQGLAEIPGVADGLAGFLAEAIRFAGGLSAAVLAGYALVAMGAVPRSLAVETYVDPFRDFFSRFGRNALLILALIATYRIADVVMGVMANVFYVDLGFEKQTIGNISTGFGLVMTILGGFLGGLLTVRYGVMRILTVGAVLAAGTNLLFAVLAGVGPVLPVLMAVIAADNLSGGIASAAFVAYLSGLTSARFTATQYALFSSMMLLLPKLIAGYSGMMVDAVGYASFFVATAALGVPVLALIVAASRAIPDSPGAPTRMPAR